MPRFVLLGYCFLFHVDREENGVLDHVSMTILKAI